MIVSIPENALNHRKLLNFTIIFRLLSDLQSVIKKRAAGEQLGG